MVGCDKSAYKLADFMSDVWVSFARNGVPDTKRFKWEVYNPETCHLQRPTRNLAGFRVIHCNKCNEQRAKVRFSALLIVQNHATPKRCTLPRRRIASWYNNTIRFCPR